MGGAGEAGRLAPPRRRRPSGPEVALGRPQHRRLGELCLGPGCAPGGAESAGLRGGAGPSIGQPHSSFRCCGGST
ncbi:hypothetical protein ACRRTK_005649 [Alexandromys fortis]